MEVIHLIFKIGVLLAIYGFIWFFINLLISLATGGRKKTISEVYFSKGVKSIFLVMQPLYTTYFDFSYS